MLCIFQALQGSHRRGNFQHLTKSDTHFTCLYEIRSAQLNETPCRFSSLSFLTQVGIETVCCSGYTYSCKKPGATPKSSHEWNCIKIDGVWTPCDSTWAAGSVGGDFQFSKHYDDFWWMVLPHQFIYTHLCEDPQV